jgi:YVTN family beta-propeller protein
MLQRRFQLLLCLPGILTVFGYAAHAADRWNRPKEAFVNWEDPHVHPLDITPDNARLLAVNTADNTLLVYSIVSGTPVLESTIPVGLDPVSVRARTATEAWVVNRISDDVTVVDLTGKKVTAVLPTDDEPADVVFAGTPQRAFVSSGKASMIDIFNPADLTVARQSVFVNGKEPRAMAVSADGQSVYAAFFESGNGTTAVTGGKVNGQEVDLVRRPEGPYGGINVPPNQGTQIVPPLNPANPPPPPVSIIVRKNATGQWLDDNNGDWTRFISGDLSMLGGFNGGRVAGWDLPDRDVAVLNANTLAVTYQTRLMNALMALAVRPSTGEVTVVGTDATNQIRWEPNLQGIFTRVNLARFVPGGSSTITDLNPHLNYTVRNVPVATRALSIGDPRGIVWTPDSSHAFITGMGSNNVIVIDGTGARVTNINVGQGPTGVVYHASSGHVFVLNKFDASISVIDSTKFTVLSTVAFFDPTPSVIKLGRPVLYNTHNTSGLGQISCASCHIDGRTDRLAWDLGNPAGTMTPMTGIDDTTGALVTVQQHPMKGPMLTQTLQDTANSPVMHWAGDRPDLTEFENAFVTLQGADAPLDTPSVNALEDFLATIHIPPNPNRNLDNTWRTSLSIPGPDNTIARTGNPVAGAQEFETNCRSCHPGNTARGQLIRQGGAFGIGLNRRGPTWRNFNERAGLWFKSADGSICGFGYQQDGTFDSTHNQSRTDNMMAFMYSVNGRFPYAPAGLDETCESRDTHAAVGTQLFFSSSTTTPQDTTLTTLVQLAEHGEIGLVAKAQVNGAMRGYAYVGDGVFQSDKRSEQDTLATLRAIPGILFTAVPAGSEIRIGIDRDLDGVYDGDQSAPAATPVYTRSTTNVAPLGKATQSSDWVAALGASNAIDGNTSTFEGTGSNDTAPFWQLQLDNKYAIDKLVIVPMASIASRSRDLSVYLLDEAGNPILRTHFLNRNNRMLSPAQITLDVLALNGGAPLHAKTVKILRTPDTFGRAQNIPGLNSDEANMLAMAEVQVYGATSALDAFNVGTTARPIPGGTFEDVPEVNTFAYTPSGTPWTFTGQAGITGNASAFTNANPPAPEGTQALFLQNIGSASQSLILAAGSYRFNFSAAQRGNTNTTAQTVVLSIDGKTLSQFTPPSSSYTAFQTANVTLTAGAHTILLSGLGQNANGTPSQDSTAFVDNVTITANAAPVITAIPAQSSTRGAAVSLQVKATDPNGLTLTYSATGLPAGLSINATTGLISGTVSATAAATNAVTVTAKDSILTSSASFAWSTAAAVPPVITSPGAQSTIRGAAVSLQIKASDPAGKAITYTASGLPLGLSINASTGLISGTVSASAAASYSSVVTVSDGSLTASASFAWTTTLIPALPIAGADIGSPTKAGSNSFGAGVYTVTGSGADIWSTSDQFRFDSQTYTGDGQIIARVTSQTNTNPNAKAGVMFRETLTAGARYVFVALTPSNGIVGQFRTTTSGTTTQAVVASNPAPNNWLRITRVGSVFTAYTSKDGVTWTQMGAVTIPMATAINVGLAVSSHDNTQLSTATFDNVQIKTN